MSDRPPLPNRPFVGEDDPDAPASAEELAASERLRDALDAPDAAGSSESDLDLVRSLRAAWSPDPLDERAHATMVDDAPLSEDELRLADELRASLEPGSGRHISAGSGAEVVEALRSCWSPPALDESEHRRIVDAAVGRAKRGADVVPLHARKGPRAPTRVGVVTATTVLALAAGVVLWITTAAPRAEAPLARARSTQPLFDEPFKAGETSARIDRIAVARASDYRDNRFATWGVR